MSNNATVYKRRTILKGGLAIAATQVASPFLSQANAQEAVTLRMHTHVPPVSGSFKNLKWWADKVEKESDGKIKIQLFGSMQLGGKPPDVYDQVKGGVVHLGWTLPGYKEGLFPVTSIFELPFIGAPASIVSPAIDTFVRKHGMKEWEDVHPIVFHSAGLSQLHMKEKAINKLEDFKGLKIRTPSRLSTSALAALGATPVPIPSLKMTEALMHNLVDGVVTPWSIALAIRTIDVTKAHTETTLHEPILAMMMNKQAYDGLPADLKKVIDANSGEAISKEFGRRWENDDKPGIAKAKSKGDEIIVVPEEEQKRWRQATQPVYTDYIKELDDKGLPGKQLIEAAEKLVEQYKAAG